MTIAMSRPLLLASGACQVARVARCHMQRCIDRAGMAAHMTSLPMQAQNMHACLLMLPMPLAAAWHLLQCHHSCW